MIPMSPYPKIESVQPRGKDYESIGWDKSSYIDQLDKKPDHPTTYGLPRNGGHWTGKPGNSEWKPDPDVEPGDHNGTNPEHKTWEEILDGYDIDGIPFNDGEPDFSEVSKGEVEISDFSDDRASNFDQADEELAKQRGCTPEEVAQWRKENGYTWHECKDTKTMQKVPTEIHGNIPHSGGISEYKKKAASGEV